MTRRDAAHANVSSLGAGRFMRPDAHRWLRPDLARLYPRGTNLEGLFPGWERVDPARRVRVRPTPRDAVAETQAAYEQISDACDLARDFAEIKQLRAELRTIGAFLAYRRAYRRYAELCKYRPDQPRVPAGHSGGGQWTRDGGGGVAGSDPDVLFDADPENTWEPGAQYAQNDASEPPGIGHNDGPSLEPPEVPKEGLGDRKTRMSFVWEAARWGARATGLGTAVDAYLSAIDQVDQLARFTDAIRIYSDPPKTLDELRAEVGNGKPGYEDHHIVEQTGARKSGFSEEQIESRYNKARIPIMKHWEINRWFSRPNPEYNNLRPRDYLRGKSWDEHMKIGLRAMREFGVLKP